MVTSSTPMWKRNLNYATKLFDLSLALGTKVMNLGGGQVRSVPPNMSYYDGLKTLVRFWKEACQQAEDVGVIVGIEHLVGDITNVANTTKQAIDLVEAVDSPSFQINAQIHHMAFTDLDVSAAIRASGDKIKLVHIADVTGYNPIIDPISYVIPGKGKLDFVTIFKAFKDVGYDGEFCMEPSSTELGEQFLHELREGRKYLETNWNLA